MTHDLDDDDESLFSEWSRSPAWPAIGSSASAPSLAPYDIAFEEEELEPRVVVSPERRRKLLQYVTATVGVCTAICLAAMVRVGVAHIAASSEAELAAARSAPVADAVALVALRTTGTSEPAPIAHPDEIPAPPATEPTVEVARVAPAIEARALAASPAPLPPLPAPSRVAVAAAVKPASPVHAPAAVVVATRAPESTENAVRTTPVSWLKPTPLGKAAQEREAARRSLEHGKAKDAVAAAERSVSLDAGDAEAWLILGAAKQEMGRGGEATAAFRSCAKSATRGPVRECRAMLH